MDYVALRKSHIKFKKDTQILKSKDFENLQKKTEKKHEKWFFSGCKHITERHYTEAIKHLQLSNTKDALLLSVLTSLKIMDEFLLTQYIEELKEDKRNLQILNKYNITIIFSYKNKDINIDEKSIYPLVSSILNR